MLKWIILHSKWSDMWLKIQGPNTSNGLGSNWQSKSPTKGLVWFGLIILQANTEKSPRTQPIQPFASSLEWWWVMWLVCFGDDFCAVIRYVLLGNMSGFDTRFKYISMSAWHKTKQSWLEEVFMLWNILMHSQRNYFCLIICQANGGYPSSILLIRLIFWCIQI